MAATCIISIHINKGKTARQCIGDRLDYIMNPKDGRRNSGFDLCLLARNGGG